MAHKDDEERNRKGLVVCAFLYTFFFVGAFFGYGPLQLLLEAEGVFSFKCTDENADEEVCPSQTTALVNISFYAQITQLVSPVLGVIVDYYGAQKTAYCMIGLSLSYLSLAMIASSQRIDWLWYPAYICSGMATWFGSLVQVPTALYFDNERTRSRIIVGLNSVFDAGSITYLSLWGLRQLVPSLSLTALLGIYTSVAVLVYTPALYFWTRAVPVTTSTPEEPDNEADFKADADAICSSNAACDDEPKGDAELQAVFPHSTDEIEKDEGGSPYVLVRDRSTRQQLLSPPFLALLTFFVIQVTANQFVLTTTRDFLAFMGDDEQGNRYLTIFTLLLPASLCAIPAVDFVMQRWGYATGGMQSVNLLALGFWTVRLASDDLNVQIVGFLFFSFYRCFLFGVYFSFLASLLAPSIVGKAAGLSFCLVGATSFLNVPLTRFSIVTKGGDFFIANLLYACFLAPCVVLALFLNRVTKREQKVKAKLTKQRSSAEAAALES